MTSHAGTIDSHGNSGSAHGHGPLPPGHFHHLEPEQAYHASKLGMWLFLATEILFFGGLFCAFAVFHGMHYEMFHEGSTHLNWVLGFVNTCVLLSSSFSMAMAVDAAQHGNNKAIVKFINFTLLGGLGFMVIKAFEYSAKFEHGLYPWTNMYFGLYYSMTGLHGIHVVVGLAILWWIRGLAKKNHFSDTYYTPVEVVGLYWHLVDVIWIYLFPLLYLIK